MSHVLKMSAFKFSNPVPVFVLMEPCDEFFHKIF